MAIVHTAGLSPTAHTADFLSKVLAEELLPALPEPARVQEVHFYGTGCSGATQVRLMTDLLQQVLPGAQIEVHHDLIAAARATAGREKGIVCILGTGSNSCLWNGSKEIDHIENLGYLVGDEGSGTHIGKEIFKTYWYREMEPELEADFQRFFPGTRDDFIDQIYGKPGPNAFLATATKFAGEHLEHPQIKAILGHCFEEFVRRHAAKYAGSQHIPVHFVGSIAVHFRPLLLAALTKYQLKAGRFCAQPIDALVEYHTTALS